MQTPRPFRIPPASRSTASSGSPAEAAMIAAIAALLGALIGAVGAAVPAVVNTDKQIDAATTVARENFLRPQQREVYARFVSNVKNLYDTEKVALEAFNQGVAVTPESRKVLASNISNAFRALSPARADVQLLGSAATVAVANRTVDDASRLYFVLQSQVDLSNAEPFGDNDGVIEVDPESINVNLNSFILAARNDLGTF